MEAIFPGSDHSVHGERQARAGKQALPRKNHFYTARPDISHHILSVQPKESFYGDQGNVGDLQKLLDEKGVEGQLDFIIDDGSHHPMHQIVSFQYLFEKALKPGGVYIIEDIEMNYWLKGETYGHSTRYGKTHAGSLMNKLKELVDVVNREFSPPNNMFSSSFGPAIDSYVSSVFFGANCVAIMKM